MTISPRNIGGTLVSRRLYSRVQPTRLEMKVMAGGAVAATIPLLTPVTQSSTTGKWGVWVPNSRIEGLVWPETYVQNVGVSGSADTVATIMTAGVVHVDDILESCVSLFGGATVLGSPNVLLYQDLFDELKDMSTNVRDDLHIVGFGTDF